MKLEIYKVFVNVLHFKFIANHIRVGVTKPTKVSCNQPERFFRNWQTAAERQRSNVASEIQTLKWYVYLYLESHN